jgi:hypothetical protein
MRTTALLTIALLTACNGGGDTDTDTDTNGDTDTPDPLDICDLDGDGWLGPQCGGTDCDDDDAFVNPGMIDSPGDGVDRNCDGHLDLSIAPLAPEPFLLTDGWAWDPDLKAFGGVVRNLSGGVGSRQIEVATYGPVPAWAAQTDFFVELGPLGSTAVRLWADEGPLDVFQVEQDDAHALVAWSEGVLRVLQIRAGTAPPWLHAAAAGARLDAATCDGATLAHTRLVLDAGQTSRHTVAEPFDRCVAVLEGDRTFIVGGTAAPGPLVRYEISSEGFSNRAELNPNISFDLARAATADSHSIFAFANGNRIWVFEGGANGSYFDVDDEIVRLAVATDGQGNAALAWTTTADELGLAWGEIGFELERTSVPISEPDTTIVVGVDRGLVALGWVEDEQWWIARSQIPQPPER